MSESFLAGQGALWVQPDGPNTDPEYLGCHELGDVDAPEGDVTLLYCPDPSGPNKFKVKGSYQGAPGPVTFSIETVVTKVGDYLEKLKCPVPIYLNFIECGRKDNFLSAARTEIFLRSRRTSRGLTKGAARTPDSQDESLIPTDWSAEEWLTVFPVVGARKSTVESNALNAIHFCNDEACADDCGAAQAICDTGYIGADAAAAATANALETTDEGASWAATSADPFAADQNILAVTCFPLDASTTRILVARDDGAGAGNMEIAYSDDGGANWTTVTINSGSNAAVDSGALFALDNNHIWLVLAGGYIAFSSDGGTTWTIQEAGVTTTNDLHAVHFVDENHGMAVGASDTVLITSDGGDTWQTATATGGAQTINTVWMIDHNVAWVGNAQGHLYYTNDNGTTWTERSFGQTTGAGNSINGIQFVNELVGFLLYDAAGPTGTVYRTRNGGFDWESITTPTNSGLNDLHVCNANLAWAVGEAQGGTGVILKVAA